MEIRTESTWFDNQQPLNRRFAVYLPSIDQSGNPIVGLEVVIDSTTNMLCDRFGGVTRFPASGRFQRGSGTTQAEDIDVLESYCDAGSWISHSPFLQVWIAALTSLLRQETIACALDGKMIFVEAIPLPEGSSNSIRPDTLPTLVAQILNDTPADGT